MRMRILNRKVVLAVGACALAACVTAAPTVRAHRDEVRKAIENPATRLKAAEAALDDADPAIRRYALYVCAEAYQADKPRYEALAKRFVTDTNTSVRILAKRMNRQNILFRENKAFSNSPENDFGLNVLQEPVVKNGVFELQKPVPKYQGVELWFGKPKQDLYVWLNDIYLGQFDTDFDKGKEFRLEAIAETKKEGPNRVVLKDAAGKPVTAPFEVKVLSWPNR